LVEHSHDDLSDELKELLRVDVVFKVKLVVVLVNLLVDLIGSNIFNAFSVVDKLEVLIFLGVKVQLIFVFLYFLRGR
jgi:hypothetical protein